ncbi:hypothetical protein WJX72_000133 [[Myrmecia] bisecta]|uniref:Mitochondrial folate transporter/carrier n=1 Tax=[Myrmecia] bisecta TaxID=41462 RepID=A0AAW1PKP8_9CHLO
MSDAKRNWKHAVAGCTAGLTSALLLHPLDVIKTRLQVQDGIKGVLPAYRGTRDALRCILQEEGPRALYSGLSPALLGAGLSWGIYFAAYNQAKQRYQKWLNQPRLSAPLHLLSAAEAGALVCCITNPVWVVKTRLQLQRGVRLPALRGAGNATAAGAVGAAKALGAAVPGANYQGFVHAVRSIAREEGIRGFYRGLLPSLLLVSHGAIQFMVYEELKTLAAYAGSPAKQHGPRKQLSSAEISVIGALSKLAASVATYPSQVIRSRLQQRMDPNRSVLYRSGWHTFRLILRREGPAGLYKGIVPNVLRVMPQSAITFLVYEKVMQLLESEMLKNHAAFS